MLLTLLHVLLLPPGAFGFTHEGSPPIATVLTIGLDGMPMPAVTRWRLPERRRRTGVLVSLEATPRIRLFDEGGREIAVRATRDPGDETRTLFEFEAGAGVVHALIDTVEGSGGFVALRCFATGEEIPAAPASIATRLAAAREALEGDEQSRALVGLAQLWNAANEVRDPVLALLAARSELMLRAAPEAPPEALLGKAGASAFLRMALAANRLLLGEEAEIAARRGFAAAVPLGRDGLELRANCAIIVGWALSRSGGSEESLEWFRTALEARREVLGRGYPEEALDLGNYALAARNADRPELAEPLLRETIALRGRQVGETHEAVLELRSALGEVLFRRGRGEAALRELLHVLAEREKKGDGRNAGVARTLTRLVTCRIAEGLFDDAFATAERAIKLWTELQGEGGGDRARVLAASAIPLASLGRLDEARDRMLAAVPVLERRFGPRDPDLLSTRAGLGGIACMLGDLDGARAILEPTLEVIRTVKPPLELHLANCLQSLAYLDYRAGNFDRARELLGEALAARERDPQAAGGASLLHPLTNLGQLELAAGRPTEAAAAFRRALEIARGQLERLMPVLPEATRLVLAASHRQILDCLVTFALRAPARPEIDSLYAAVLGWKGQVARGLLAQRAWLAERRDADTVEKLEALRVRLGKARIQDLGLVREREHLEQELYRADPFRLPSGAPDLASVRSGLEDGDVLLDFLVIPAGPELFGEARLLERSRSIVAFAVRNRGPIRLVDLGDAATIERALDAHLLVTRRRSRPVEGDPSSFSRPLLDALWGPLTAVVGNASRVFVAPEGALGLLPFESLPGEAPGTFLIEQHQFVYVQSAFDLIAVEPKAPAPTIVFAGAIDYGIPDAGADETPRWPPLPGTRDELDAIIRLCPEGFQAVVLDGSRATTTALTAAAPTAGILHFATHGHFGPGRAASSRRSFSDERARSGAMRATSPSPRAVHLALSDASLVLADANRPTPKDDGLLGADEAAWLDLRRCRLVVLSACETGLATVDAAEELLGLRRAFRLAGAAATVSALWKVDDAQTTALMVDFYRRHFVDHLPFSRALHEARLALLRENREKHGDPLPATFGAFVFDGRDG